MTKFIILAIFLCLICFTSCKKDQSTTSVTTDTGATDNLATCNATKADAENIRIFPVTNGWNKDISASAVDPYSSQIIAKFATSIIHADFGSGTWDGAPIGIPYVVVCSSQQKYTVKFRANSYDGNYGNESDKGPYAIPLDAPIEGNGTDDAHVIAVDKDSGILYELYNASVVNGQWQASSGAIFHFNTNKLRHLNWTSADAAGLPIFAGLVRYDELLKGKIDHAIRFTLNSTNVYPGFISPARHKVNSTGQLHYSLPFGARIRLKASYNISGFSANNQIILQAMKTYGLILADIGSNMYISGAPDSRWNNDDLHKLDVIKGSDFEVVNFE